MAIVIERSQPPQQDFGYDLYLDLVVTAQMTKILIIAGFIGSNLARRLVSESMK